MKQFLSSAVACLLLAVWFVLPATSAEAACAKVSIEILQELTIERTAFDAKLVLTNGIADQSLENIRVDVVVRDGSGNLKNDLFFVRPPTLSGIGGALDGTGSVTASGRGEAHWLIIPSPGAGYLLQDGSLKQIGVDYWVGATLSYIVNGHTETVPINPAKITVRPMPQLVLDYFMPYSVLGDNPFTTQVEAPIPYPLGLRVLNDGYGPALKLKIDSAQPKIVDNQQGLLIAFKLLGASVNDGAVSPSLTVNFGDLVSKKVGTAVWQMISTLSGRFVEFKASFCHASELGGELTSLLRETNTHYLAHMVKVNLPGRDGKLDFLADLNESTGFIYESEIPNATGRMEDARSPVTVLQPVAAPARPTGDKPSVTLNLPTGTATGWIYTKFADPSQGMLKLLGVTRNDGVKLDNNNYWIDEGLDKNYQKTWTLQFVDYRADAATTSLYTLAFAKPDTDTAPPVSRLEFDGPYSGTDPVYITSQTKVIVVAADNDGGSGVEAMYRKLVGTDTAFINFLPFSITTPGSSTLEYYSVDRAGNVEATKTTRLVVDDAKPVISEFTASPTSIAPHAPVGVTAAKSLNFGLIAKDTNPSLPVTIEISQGDTFSADRVIRTLKGTATSETRLSLFWDGKDATGKLVAVGPYTARVTVTDGLETSQNVGQHSATSTISITVVEWLAAEPLDPNPAAEQKYPRITGSKVVWQDMRNGNWDIYFKDKATGRVKQITTDAQSQEYPAIDGDLVVWQDMRNGNSDIYGYNLVTNTEFVVYSGPGSQERPVVSGQWVAWQDNRSANWDIYLKNITTNEVIQVTSHERDQIRPTLFGNLLAWEDYRHGAAEIYQFDISSRTETRITVNDLPQTEPVLSGSALVWTDERNGLKEIYAYDAVKGTRRVATGSGDRSAAVLSGDRLVFVDYDAGLLDPNLSFLLLSSGVGGRLISHSSVQEAPSIGPQYLVWQDGRDGKYQIYFAALQTEASPIELNLWPGLNLVAVGNELATAYPTASALLAAKKDELGIDRVLLLDTQHTTYINSIGNDFPLSAGTGLALYVTRKGTLRTAASGESVNYTLLPGTNQIGILTVPYGYSAYQLAKSIGLDNLRSVRRFDNSTDLWQTVMVKEGSGELVGIDFTITPGDGLLVTVRNRVDGWTP